MTKEMFNPHDVEKDLRVEIDDLLGFKTTNEQFYSLIQVCYFSDSLIAKYDQYDFIAIRKKISQFIDDVESVLSDQALITNDMDSLCPIINEMSIQNVVTVNLVELALLKKLRSELSRSKNSKGAKGYVTKRAYFELFFIGELLGLPAVTKAGEKNDLITLVEIMTRQNKPNRPMLSEHYQKYEYFKKMTPEVNSLILNGKRRFVNNPQFSSSLEQFQINIYPYIPIPSPK